MQQFLWHVPVSSTGIMGAIIEDVQNGVGNCSKNSGDQLGAFMEMDYGVYLLVV